MSASQEAERARRYLAEGDAALGLGTCEAALAGASGEEAVALAALAARAARGVPDLAACVRHLEAAEAAARAEGLDVLGGLLVQLGDAHLRRGEPGRAAVALDEALGHLAPDDDLRPRAEALLEEARRREAAEDEDDAEEPAPVVSAGRPSLAEPPAAERLLAMVDHLLESDPDMELPALLDLVLAELVQAAEADRGFVLLREPGEGLVVRAARDARGRPVPSPGREVSRKVAERAAAEAVAIRAVRPAEDPRFADSRSAKALDLRAVVAAPLRYRKVDLGSVVLDRRGADDVAFDDAAEGLAARFARLASGVIVRTRMRDAQKRRADALQDAFARGAAQVRERFDAGGFVGESEAVYRLLSLLERVAPAHARVLIRGESGTGKELVARLIHANSPRRAAPFHPVNCAALTESLLEAELFGHAKGAFSGAEADRPGLFERAHGGTVFLDEIGDASPRLQGELLRVLEEGEVRRLGDGEVRQVDVRVLAATHRDLQAMTAEGRFREDLYYRLSVVEVPVPPLRARPEDVPLLARRFAAEAREAHPDAPGFLDDEALVALQERPWPGNVRELRNVVTRLVTLGELAAKAEAATPEPAPVAEPIGAGVGADVPTLADVERRAIVRALRAAGGQKKEAARLLGIGRRTLYDKLRTHGL